MSPVFSDSFATGDLTHAENGYSWGSGTGSVVVDSADAYEGSNSLALTHPGQADCQDSSQHQEIVLPDVTELWMEVRIHIDPNYHHRDQFVACGSSDNNKFFQFYSDNERSSPDKLWVDFEVNENEPNSTLRPVRDNNFDISQTVSGALGGDFISDTERGQWNLFQVHTKVGTFDNNDGVLQLLWNSVTWLDRTDLDLYKDPDGPGGEHNYFSRCRLNGWANSGYDSETVFRYDAVKIYTSDPGWVF